MAEYPAMPMWTDAYLSDTRHLSTLEHGAYLLLLMEAWRRPTCSLPDDDRMLARLAGVSEADWSAIKPVVMDFWTLDGRSKTWHQKRQKKERDFLASQSAKQRDRALKRWKDEKTDNAAAIPDGCRNDAPTPTPTPIEKELPNGSSKKQGSSKRGTRLTADWKLPRAWGEWAVSEGMDEVSVRREADTFRDYWISQPGQKGVKLDWQATWRNWIRKALERQPRRPAAQPEIGQRVVKPDGTILEYEGGAVGWQRVYE